MTNYFTSQIVRSIGGHHCINTGWISKATEAQRAYYIWFMLFTFHYFYFIYHKCKCMELIAHLSNNSHWFSFTFSFEWIPGWNVFVAIVWLVCCIDISHFDMHYRMYCCWMDVWYKEFCARYWIYDWTKGAGVVVYMLEIHYSRHFNRM